MPAPKPALSNGGNPLPGATLRLGGGKLLEASSYLKSARECLLTWGREAQVNSGNVDDVLEVLGWSQSLALLRQKLEVKGSILGK